MLVWKKRMRNSIWFGVKISNVIAVFLKVKLHNFIQQFRRAEASGNNIKLQYIQSPKTLDYRCL